MQAKPLNLVRPEVPAELAAVVAKMMAKDPAKRYQKPVEVAQALTPFIKPGARLAPVTGSARELSLGAATPKGSTPDERSVPAAKGPTENATPQAPAVEPFAFADWDTLTGSITAPTGSRVSATAPAPSTPVSGVPDVAHSGRQEAKGQRSKTLLASIAIVGSVVVVLGLIIALSAQQEEPTTKPREPTPEESRKRIAAAEERERSIAQERAQEIELQKKKLENAAEEQRLQARLKEQALEHERQLREKEHQAREQARLEQEREKESAVSDRQQSMPRTAKPTNAGSKKRLPLKKITRRFRRICQPK